MNKHFFKDLNHARNISIEDPNDAIYLSSKLDLVYGDYRSKIKSIVKEKLILSMQDKENLSILYGNFKNIEMSKSEQFKSAIDNIERFKSGIVSMAPFTVVNINDFTPKINFLLWSRKSTLDDDPMCFSSNNVIIDYMRYSKIENLIIGGSSLIGEHYGSHRLGFMNTRYFNEVNGDNASLILSNRQGKIAYQLMRNDFQHLKIDDYNSILYQLEKIADEMKSYYIEDMGIPEYTNDFALLNNSLLLSKLKIQRYLNAMTGLHLHQKTPIIADPLTSETIPNSIDYIQKIESILKDYLSYSIDLVKMMNHPTMVDLTIPEVGSLDSLCEDYRIRLDCHDVFVKNDYLVLNTAFRRALRLSETNKLSHLDKDKQSNIRDAQQMLTKAMHEKTEEAEKRLALKGMSNKLEGVLPVNDNLMNKLAESIGLRELTL